jgi:hypothetical protein
MRPLLLAGLASLAHTVVPAQSPPRLYHVAVVVRPSTGSPMRPIGVLLATDHAGGGATVLALPRFWIGFLGAGSIRPE